MPSASYLPDASFAPAPASARIRLAILMSAVISVLAGAVVAGLLLRDPHAPRVLLVFAGAAPAMLAAILWVSHIQRYRLAGEEILVELRFRTVRFPLAGLVSASMDREAMRHAWKVFANDGLGAYSGRFRSRRLGSFRAYLTDAERAVVLRWPDHCVVISPEQPSYFLEAMRKRAGLSR